MLQQTQAATVIPYFARFLAAFPNVHALAHAAEQEVLCLWEGLGYYRRARFLHQAAQIICAKHAGQLPTDPTVLGQLPGLGRYTVNAILSQALDQRLPILEANSQRVLCRLLGMEDDPRRAAVRKHLWRTAEELLPRRRVGAFNQALMELGALLCTPTNPACPQCPVANYCAARRHNRQESIPRRSPKPRIEHVQEVALVLWQGNKVLLVQRPLSGRWPGLWEFPHVSLESGESLRQGASRLASVLGLEADVGPELMTLQHAVTRFRITLTCLEARHRRGTVEPDLYPQVRWIMPAQALAYPLSSPQRRLAKTVSSIRG